MEGELITDETIEFFFDTSDQPWFKEEDIGSYIGMTNIFDQTRKLTCTDRKTRSEVPSTSSCHETDNDDDDDVFPLINGITTVTTLSRKPKARQVSAWIIRDVLRWAHKSKLKKQEAVIRKHELTLIAKEIRLSACQKELKNLHMAGMHKVTEQWLEAIRHLTQGDVLARRRRESAFFRLLRNIFGDSL